MPHPSAACFSLLLCSLLSAQQPGSFESNFAGLGLGAVTPLAATPIAANWDIAVHSRDIDTWFTLESMQAAHGANTAPPPATHLIDAYEDSVYVARQHLMTALNASGYGVIYATPNALADFHDGECVICFDVSTLRTSSRDWIDVWLTPWQDNMQLPMNNDVPDLQGTPRRGLQVRMRLFTAQFPGQQPVDWTYFDAFRYDNWAATPLPANVAGYEQLLTPSATQRESFELRISKTGLKFGIPTRNLWWVDATFAALDFDRAVVQFGHHSYNPAKAGTSAPIGHDPALAGTANPSAMTWHWDNFEVTPALRFDVIKSDRRFVAGSAPAPAVLDRAAPVDSFLRFSAIGTVQVSFDGAAMVPAIRQDGSEQASGNHAVGHFSSYWMPIPAGTTRVDFQLAGEGWWGNRETLAKDIAVWSLSVGGAGCSGTGSVTPAASHPTPTLGSPVFGIQLVAARPTALAVAAVSLAEQEAPPCGVAVSLDPLHLGSLQAYVTDSAGAAFHALPLPNVAALAGTAIFAQWFVIDPQGALPAYGYDLAATPLRRIVIE